MKARAPALFAATCASMSPSTSRGLRTFASRISKILSVRLPRERYLTGGNRIPSSKISAGKRKAPGAASANIAVMSAIPGKHQQFAAVKNWRDERDIRKVRAALIGIVQQVHVAFGNSLLSEGVKARQHRKVHGPDVARTITRLCDELCVGGE